MSQKMSPDDPSYWMLFDEFTTTPEVYHRGCYICEDEEFAQMGLPLCRKCKECDCNGCENGHIPADDEECTCCGYNDHDEGFFSYGFTLDGNKVGKHNGE